MDIQIDLQSDIYFNQLIDDLKQKEYEIVYQDYIDTPTNIHYDKSFNYSDNNDILEPLIICCKNKKNLGFVPCRYYDTGLIMISLGLVGELGNSFKKQKQILEVFLLRDGRFIYMTNRPKNMKKWPTYDLMEIL